MNTDFFDKYQYKILSRDQLAEKIEPFPRSQKVIMCHGVFDVVHPGHVRHLAYAKSKADILIASITADVHIKKGIYRPHVPQQVRALNLAAFEMVDYVVIDQNATPLENIEFLKPDFFAKGFEYTDKGLPAATQEEANLIASYGGEMIFTPGDVVYSSSRFITLAEPDIGTVKLLALMKERDVTFDKLKDYVTSFSDLSVHVVGDTIIDSYTRTSLIGGQTKTPTLSVLHQSQDKYIGGAGIISQHLAAAGAKVTFSTILGDDQLKDFTIQGLKQSGVNIQAIIDSTRPTTNKNVIIADGYRLLKIDTLDNRPISKDILELLSSQIQREKCDAVVFGDFRHGIFNKKTIPTLTAAIPDTCYKVADSQVASRWGNITEFTGFDLITPNEREARFALADQDSTLGSLSNQLNEKCKNELLILKLGARGVFVTRKYDQNKDVYFSIDSFADHVVDAVGAGDALLAYSTLTMMKSNCEVSAAIIGSMAAACECEIDGNVPITPKNVLRKIEIIEKLSSYR